MKIRLIALLSLASLSLTGEPAGLPPDAIVDQYCAATRNQATRLKSASMDMDIEASLPKLKKQGTFHALRRISALGRITYEALKFDGDNTVKKYVINNYLSAEAQAQNSQPDEMSVTPANYKFKYKGLMDKGGRELHIFEVTPRRKAAGLFKGELWIDPATYLRVQESGRLVKNPSILLKRVEFVRDYEIRDGISLLTRVQSTVTARLVGKAELKIDYTNVSVDAPLGVVSEAEAQ